MDVHITIQTELFNSINSYDSEIPNCSFVSIKEGYLCLLDKENIIYDEKQVIY